jgi:putative ABC transport system ATP-binding protein
LGHVKVEALKNVNLEINKGEFITIMGPSGSGKSTLLHILGFLDLPDNGSYQVEDQETIHLSDRELARIRNQHFGFIFQSFNLFQEFNALENVMLPLVYAKVTFNKRKERAIELLNQVGLGHRIYHYPNMLSGGEQQRVSIARALANNPTVILADEPTGNLPSRMGLEILNIIWGLNQQNVSVIMVTHDDKLARCGSRLIQLHDGQIVADKPIEKRFDPGAALAAFDAAAGNKQDKIG